MPLFGKNKGLAGCDKKNPEGCLLNGKSKRLCNETKTDEESVCGGREYDNKIAETYPGSKERKELESACKRKIKMKKGLKKMYCKAYKDGTKWMAAKKEKERKAEEKAVAKAKKEEEKRRKKENAARQRAQRNAKNEPSFTSEPIPDYIMRALKPKKSMHPEYGKLRY